MEKTIPVTATLLKDLRLISIKNGTLKQWSEIAMDWIEQAEIEINKHNAALEVGEK